ncbi:MAG: hypothetical protein H6729_08935 [Deltaproteobacteria bacterium]|nr:hypothetical protein [Deltaproteobacteria bacterium]
MTAMVTTQEQERENSKTPPSLESGADALPLQSSRPESTGAETEQALPVGAVPTAPIREESVSVFDPKSGDGSRSLVVIVVIAVLLLLIGVMFLTEAPSA